VLRLVRTEDAQAGIGPAQLSPCRCWCLPAKKNGGRTGDAGAGAATDDGRIVDGLVQKKLAERVSSANDRRTVKITATPAGVSCCWRAETAGCERWRSALMI